MSKPRYADLEALFDAFDGTGDLDEPRAEKRRRILTAASRRFLDQGYRKTTVEEVAEDAGVAKGTVYLYFPSKADLLIHAVAEEKRTYVLALAPVLTAQMPAPERLRTWIRVGLGLAEQMPLTARLLRGDREILAVVHDLGDAWSQMVDTQLEVVAELLGEAAPHLRRHRARLLERTRILMGLLFAAALTPDARLRGGLDPERWADGLSHLIVDGILAKEGTR